MNVIIKACWITQFKFNTVFRVLNINRYHVKCLWRLAQKTIINAFVWHLWYTCTVSKEILFSDLGHTWRQAINYITNDTVHRRISEQELPGKEKWKQPTCFLVKHEVRPSVSQFHETVSNGRKITDIPIDTKIFLGNHPGLGEDLWLPKACKFGHCKHATAPRVNLKSNGNVMYPNVQMFTLQNENASIFVLYLWTRKNMVVYIVGDPPRINRRFRGLTMENIVTFFPLNLSITNSKFIDNI